MAVYVCFGIFAAVIVYITAASVVTSGKAVELSKRRREIVDLYVMRVNLMPVFFSAARKSSPIPGELYNRYLNARERFVNAGNDKDIQNANLELDGVYADFFAHYSSCREPLYIKTQEDYAKLMEKIHFQSRFYEEAYDRLKQVENSWLRFGAKAAQAFYAAVNKLFNRLKHRGKSIE